MSDKATSSGQSSSSSFGPLKIIGYLFLFYILAVIGVMIWAAVAGFDKLKDMFGGLTKGAKQLVDVKTMNCPKGRKKRGELCYEECKTDETSDLTHGCYKKGPPEWPGKTSLLQLHHHTKWMPTKGVPSVCDKPNEHRHDGLCYRIEDNEKYGSPGFIKLKKCPSNTKRDDGIYCWIYDLTTFGRDGYSYLKSNPMKRCEDDYGKGTCEKEAAMVYPKCTREAQYFDSEIKIKDMCMQLKEREYGNGQPIELWSCFGRGKDTKHRKQRLYYDVDTKEIKYGQHYGLSKCLDVKNKSGETAKLWDCDNSENQKFDYGLHDGRFKWAKDNSMCLSLVSGSTEKGTRFELAKCNNSDTQVFKSNPVHKYKSTGAICQRDSVNVLKTISRVGYVAKKCPEGQENKAGLCYPKCPSGYERRGDNIGMCSTICPKGFRNDGISGCARPRRNVGVKSILAVGVCPESHPLKKGALCYKHQKDIK